MSAERYFDRCAEVASAIDIDELCELSLGAEIGRGEQVSMRTLGEVSLLGVNIYCGIKVPNVIKTPARAQLDLACDISNVELLLEYAPDLTGKVPRFMLGLSIGNDEKLDAVLTEDASRGGELYVRPFVNIPLLRKLSESVRGSEMKVDEDSLTDSLSFLVDGEERLLDFTPPPIRHEVDLHTVDDHVYDRISGGDLILPVDPASNLGQSLVAAAV